MRCGDGDSAPEAHQRRKVEAVGSFDHHLDAHLAGSGAVGQRSADVFRPRVGYIGCVSRRRARFCFPFRVSALHQPRTVYAGFCPDSW